MNIIFSPRCLSYGTPLHPESPDRVRLAVEYLQGRALQGEAPQSRRPRSGNVKGEPSRQSAGPERATTRPIRHPTARPTFEFVEPKPAREEDILKVHSLEHLRRLKTLDFYDGDSPAYQDIFKYAALSAGGAIAAAMQGGFSLMRPPGHHAGKSSVAGFCYLNNIAVAVRKLGTRTLIIDIDGHHGNGTQEIFLDDPYVTFVSLHRSPLYPGTGFESVRNCHNYPISGSCGDRVYLETLDKALSSVDTGVTEQVAISAGFDTYEYDPLASLGLTTEAYRKIGERIARLRLPVFAVLEGGYDAANLGRNIEQLILGLAHNQRTP
jgi:acetoin utilization deacetylase AcuC-like enzyme